MSLGAEEILARVARVPEGFVTTYGDLCPQAPRHAGFVLSQAAGGVPWWRVVRADGSLPKGAQQREALLAEGVPLRGERVELARARVPGEALL